MNRPPLALLHIALACAALILGAFIFAMRKGTRRHRQVGYGYVIAMLATNLSALFIFRLSGHPGPFHLAALFSLATTAAGFVPAYTRRPRDSWLARHYEFMAWSYVGLLAAAAAEATSRLPAAPFWGTVIGTSAAVIAAGGVLIVRNRARFKSWAVGTNIPSAN